MQIYNIQNNYKNIYPTNQRKFPNFRGSVSQEFVDYVESIRTDCLNSVPDRTVDFVNCECDSILEKSDKMMKKYFPETSSLSIDTTEDSIDIFTLTDSSLKKFSENDTVRLSFISKSKDADPLDRLLTLRKRVIRNDLFTEAVLKEHMLFQNVTIPDLNNENVHIDDKETLQGLKNLTNWWKNNIAMVKSDVQSRTFNWDNTEFCELALSEMEEVLNKKTEQQM